MQQKIEPQALGATTLWTYPVGLWGVFNYQSPCVADMNNDGFLDVIIGETSGDKIFCIKHDGTLLWSFSNFGTFLVSHSPTIADINNDGWVEVLVAASNFITCIDRFGTLLWTANVGTATDLINCFTPTIADLDNDGKLEILVTTTDSVSPYTPFLHCLDNYGALKWQRQLDATAYGSPAVADMDGNDVLEVVVATFCPGIVHCFNFDGVNRWKNPLETPIGYINSSPVIANIDGVGTPEVIVASVLNNIYCLDGSFGTLKWNRTTAGSGVSTPAIADIGGNPGLEIIVGSQDGSVTCLNYNGTIRWVEIITPFMIVESSPAVGDLNNDGIMEIIVGGTDNYTYCLHDSQNPLQRFVFKYQTGYVVLSSPCLADLNNDGRLEVLVSSFESNLYCLQITGLAAAAKTTATAAAPWYCYMGSSFRTGQMDTDSDLLDDVTEGFYGTTVDNADSDGDGFLDGREVFANADPNNSSDIPFYTTSPPPTTSTPPTNTTSPPTTSTPPTNTSPSPLPTTSSPTAFITAMTTLLTFGSLVAISVISLIIYKRRK